MTNVTEVLEQRKNELESELAQIAAMMQIANGGKKIVAAKAPATAQPKPKRRLSPEARKKMLAGINRWRKQQKAEARAKAAKRAAKVAKAPAPVAQTAAPAKAARVRKPKAEATVVAAQPTLPLVAR